MGDIITTIASVVLIILIIQVLDIPEWLNKHLKQRSTSDELVQRIENLEKRIEKLEQKLP